jgi:hypothetical protein
MAPPRRGANNMNDNDEQLNGKKGGRNQSSKAVSGWNDDDLIGGDGGHGNSARGPRRREPSIDLDEPIEETKPQRKTNQREFNNSEQEIGKFLSLRYR